MLPRKIFENLRTVMAILLLFERLRGKFCVNVLPLILSALQNVILCANIFDGACGVRVIATDIE